VDYLFDLRRHLPSAVLLEIGVIGLFAALLVGSTAVAAAAATIVAGLAAFGAHVAWMVRHRVRRPAGARRPDFAVLTTASATPA